METHNPVEQPEGNGALMPPAITQITGPARANITNALRPQAWLTQGREWAYHQLANTLRTMDDTALKQMIINLFNTQAIETRGTAIQPEELEGMTLRFVEGEMASKIAGDTIVRPVFHFTDIGRYQRFCNAWRGQITSRGMCVEIETDDGPLSLLFTCGPLEAQTLEKNQLQIGSAKEYTEHEILHSIDPYLHTREGYDRVLCEALTYYDPLIANPVPMQKPKWGFYEEVLKGYFDMWFDGKEHGSKEKYEATCEELVNAIRAAKETHEPIDIQRMLASSRTVEQFRQKSVNKA